MQNAILHLLVLLISGAAAAQIDPKAQWSVMESTHFDVIFNAKQQDLANEVFRQAEKARSILPPLFKIDPPHTVIVILDNTDATNGSATPIPRPTIMMFPVLPKAMDSLTNYGNWAQDLITHEYTHILNFEPSSGFISYLRKIFGNIVRPNALLPRWYLEGLAVELETQMTAHGRGRSPLYDAMVRALVEDSKLRAENISRVNEVRIPTFPMGQRPYFLGALLWRKMIELKGNEVIGILNERYSGRIPFFINGPAEDNFEKGYGALLEETYEDLEDTAHKQFQIVQSATLTKGSILTTKDLDVIHHHGPTLSPDGKKLIYIQQTLTRNDEIVLRTRTKNNESFLKSQPKVLYSGENISKVSWENDESIIFDAVDTHERYYELSDLYRFSLKTKEVTQLTHGARAIEPTIFAGQKKVVFTKLGAGESALFSLDLDNLSAEPMKVYSPPLLVRVSRPTFVSPSTIVFSERGVDGVEKLIQMNLESMVTADLVTHKNVGFAQPSEAGLLFASSESGISNIYLKKPGAPPVGLTNTATHIANGILDSQRKELILTRLTGSGYRLEFTPFKESGVVVPEVTHSYPPPGQTPEPNPPPTAKSTSSSKRLPATTVQTTASLPEPKEYSGSKYLWPQYWIPFFSPITEGFVAQALVNGSDPLEHHAYSFQTSYDSLTQKPSLGLSYINSQTPALISATVSDIYAYQYGFKISQRNSAGSLVASFFVPGLSNSYRAGLGWDFVNTTYDGIPVTRTRSGPIATFKYAGSVQKGYQISPMSGGDFSLGAGYYLPNGQQISYAHAFANGTGYFSKWLPKNHAIMGRLNSSFSPDNRSILFGTTTAGGEYMASLLTSRYVVRGYPTGEFIGWTLLNATLEYRFPISYPYTGNDTLPLFTKKWSGAIIADGVTLDGIYFDSSTRAAETTKLGSYFVGVGAEARVDVTLAYHLAATLRLGLYQGLERKAYGGLSPYFGFSIEGL